MSESLAQAREGKKPSRSFSNIVWLCLQVLATIGLAFGLRMLEWPAWQNPEYSLGGEMLLATHDAYHWLSGAVGFGRAADHPMAVMLRNIADLLDLAPATVAFWSPAVFASIVAGLVHVWAIALGGGCAGMAAGLIASIAPGFLGRTLLGYYDTDIITLFFPLLIAIVPACWAMRFLLRPALAAASLARHIGLTRIYKMVFRREAKKITVANVKLSIPSGNPLAWEWLAALAISGLIAWWTQQWHSVFPYLIRYNTVLLFCICLLMASKGKRCGMLSGALAYALPAICGFYGLLAPLAIIGLCAAGKTALIRNAKVATVMWLATFMLLARGDIFNTILNHINAYLKHSGDLHASGAAALMFPSVAQSIIEVQDLSFAALFPYFHPWMDAAILGMAGFVLVLFKRPGALFLLPLAALGLLSSRLGGRMVMFGAPVVAIGLTLPCCWLAMRLLGSTRLAFAARGLVCLLLCGIMVAPFVDMIPALSQGPVINRRHAAALAEAQSITPPDAMLWLWWDWGYAAHYFARRNTIADGALHGGPSLYLPAAVLATHNARFARQIIRRTSAVGNEPGNFFKDMQADTAQELLNRLRSSGTPLVAGKGRQYLVVSFEMLRLGFWISNFGNWNFITCQSEGGALSIVPQALSYKLATGEVRLEDNQSIIFPTSITVFDETGVIRRNYVQEWFDANPNASEARKSAWLASRRNVNFLFNRVTDEKLAVDEGIYNSMMVQLLICDPHDPRFSPYFRLVFDNVFARIYEVLPESPS